MIRIEKGLWRSDSIRSEPARLRGQDVNNSTTVAAGELFEEKANRVLAHHFGDFLLAEARVDHLLSQNRELRRVELRRGSPIKSDPSATWSTPTRSMA